MSNEGQGLLSHFYLGIVCCVLIRGRDIRLAFTEPLVPWFLHHPESTEMQLVEGIPLIVYLKYFFTEL